MRTYIRFYERKTKDGLCLHSYISHTIYFSFYLWKTKLAIDLLHFFFLVSIELSLNYEEKFLSRFSYRGYSNTKEKRIARYQFQEI